MGAILALTWACVRSWDNRAIFPFLCAWRSIGSPDRPSPLASGNFRTDLELWTTTKYHIPSALPTSPTYLTERHLIHGEMAEGERSGRKVRCPEVLCLYLQLDDLSANKLKDLKPPPMSWLQVPSSGRATRPQKRRKIQIPVDSMNLPKHDPLTHAFGKQVSCQLIYYSTFHVISQNNPLSTDGSATGRLNWVAQQLGLSPRISVTSHILSDSSIKYILQLNKPLMVRGVQHATRV